MGLARPMGGVPSRQAPPSAATDGVRTTNTESAGPANSDWQDVACKQSFSFTIRQSYWFRTVHGQRGQARKTKRRHPSMDGSRFDQSRAEADPRTNGVGERAGGVHGPVVRVPPHIANLGHQWLRLRLRLRSRLRFRLRLRLRLRLRWQKPIHQKKTAGSRSCKVTPKERRLPLRAQEDTREAASRHRAHAPAPCCSHGHVLARA